MLPITVPNALLNGGVDPSFQSEKFEPTQHGQSLESDNELHQELNDATEP